MHSDWLWMSSLQALVPVCFQLALLLLLLRPCPAAAALPCCCGPALLLRPCPAAAAMPCCLPIVHLRFVNVFRALSPFQRSSSCLTGHQPGALRTKRMFARDPQARCRTPKRMLSLIPRVSWASARPLASPSAMKRVGNAELSMPMTHQQCKRHRNALFLS